VTTPSPSVSSLPRNPWQSSTEGARVTAGQPTLGRARSTPVDDSARTGRVPREPPCAPRGQVPASQRDPWTTRAALTSATGLPLRRGMQLTSARGGSRRRDPHRGACAGGAPGTRPGRDQPWARGTRDGSEVPRHGVGGRPGGGKLLPVGTRHGRRARPAAPK
jgi:hypothetical protein